MIKIATKFNSQICEELCALHSEGLPQKSCASLVGIDRKTLYNWIQKGKKAKSGKYRDFYLDWLKAEAEYEKEHLEHISNSPSWLAHQYLLQVKDPEMYVVAEKQEMDATVNADARVNADIDVTSDEFMKKELDILNAVLKGNEDDTDC